jgi:hypothetical protein
MNILFFLREIDAIEGHTFSQAPQNATIDIDNRNSRIGNAKRYMNRFAGYQIKLVICLELLQDKPFRIPDTLQSFQ